MKSYHGSLSDEIKWTVGGSVTKQHSTLRKYNHLSHQNTYKLRQIYKTASVWNLDWLKFVWWQWNGVVLWRFLSIRAWQLIKKRSLNVMMENVGWNTLQALAESISALEVHQQSHYELWQWNQPNFHLEYWRCFNLVKWYHKWAKQYPKVMRWDVKMKHSPDLGGRRIKGSVQTHHQLWPGSQPDFVLS